VGAFIGQIRFINANHNQLEPPLQNSLKNSAIEVYYPIVQVGEDKRHDCLFDKEHRAVG